MHNEESPLEGELRAALVRVEAPPGFADSVLQRLAASTGQSRADIHALPEPAATSRGRSGVHGLLRFPDLRLSSGLAAALLLLLMMPLGDYLYQRHRQARAEAAAEQFALAMRLTHAALLDAGEQVAGHRRTRNTD